MYNLLKKLSFLLILILNLSFISKPKYTTGKLVKGTIDGCTWLIELKDKKILQPVNIEKFNLKLKDGKKLKFTYAPLKKSAGFCMMGDMVELLDVKK